MGVTYTDQNNPLVRRSGAALINLQNTPMLPSGTGAVEHYSDPQVTAVHTSSSYSRQHFTNWSSNLLAKVKTKDGLPVQSKLRLRCRSYNALMIGDAAFPHTDETWAITLAGAAGPPNMIQQSSAWDGGDNKVYGNVTIYLNIDTGMQDVDGDGDLEQTWTITVADWEISTSGNINFVSGNTTYQNLSPNIGSAGSVMFSGSDQLYGGQDFSDIYIYADFSNEVGYADMLQNYPDDTTVQDNYGSANQVFRSVRTSAQSAHGLKDYVDYAFTNWVIALKKTDGTTSNEKNGLFTYILDDNEPPYGAIQKNLVKAQWYFEPAGCDDCYFAGKTVTIEAKFKKALIDRACNLTSTVGDSTDFSVTINAWNDHTTETYTLTLPSSLNAQTVGTEFNFPTLAGHVIALDDLKIVSIS